MSTRTRIKLLLVGRFEVRGPNRLERARAQLDAFREAVQPGAEYGITLYQATAKDAANASWRWGDVALRRDAPSPAGEVVSGRMMKRPAAMSKKDLTDVVGLLQHLLWFDDERQIWDGGREWRSAADLVDAVAAALRRAGLEPAEAVTCQNCSDKTDEVGDCEYCWDCCRSVCNHVQVREDHNGCFEDPVTCLSTDGDSHRARPPRES